MKTALITMSAMAILVLTAQAQSPRAENSEPKPNQIRRLESVSWDLKTHTLHWTVQKGTEVNGAFVPAAEERYEVSPDDAMMKFAGEKRGFETDEAALLHRLLDTISVYCAQSVVWWEHGEGTPITDSADRTAEQPTAKPAPPAKKPAAKPAETIPARALPVGVAEMAAHPGLRQ